eukprot:m.72085 g.72085  ORF g.72085 m.72085 type:complete len:434 (-) comp16943_c0_seq1:141-1442(-)
MTGTALLLVLLVAGGANAQFPPSPQPPSPSPGPQPPTPPPPVQCSVPNVQAATCTCGSRKFDLSGLVPSSTQSYFSQNFQGQYTYYFQIAKGGLPTSGVGSQSCSKYTHQPSSAPLIAQGTDSTTPAACNVLALAAEQTWTYHPSEQNPLLVIDAAGGDGGRQVRIVLFCDPSEQTSHFDVGSENPHLTYNFFVTTPLVCNSGPAPPPTPPPPSPSPSPTPARPVIPESFTASVVYAEHDSSGPSFNLTANLYSDYNNKMRSIVTIDGSFEVLFRYDMNKQFTYNKTADVCVPNTPDPMTGLFGFVSAARFYGNHVLFGISCDTWLYENTTDKSLVLLFVSHANPNTPVYLDLREQQGLQDTGLFFKSFSPTSTFDPAVFAIPSACTKSQGLQKQTSAKKQLSAKKQAALDAAQANSILVHKVHERLAKLNQN